MREKLAGSPKRAGKRRHSKRRKDVPEPSELQLDLFPLVGDSTGTPSGAVVQKREAPKEDRATNHGEADNEQSRHKEIESRYKRHSQRTRGEVLTNLRTSELRKIYRRRLGPELSKAQIDAAIFEAVGNPLEYSSKELGKLIKLRFEERDLLGVRTIAAFDKTPAEVAVIKRGRKRIRDREYRRRHRAERKARLKTTQDLTVRAEALFAAIGPGEKRVPGLTHDVRHHECWRSANGRRLTAKSFARTVHRELDWLKNNGWIDDRYEQGRRGAMVRIVCRLR
jgi:hypothetical protein